MSQMPEWRAGMLTRHGPAFKSDVPMQTNAAYPPRRWTEPDRGLYTSPWGELADEDRRYEQVIAGRFIRADAPPLR